MEKAPPDKVPTESVTPNRAGENLLGQANTSQGEGRRNENVQINLRIAILSAAGDKYDAVRSEVATAT